MNKSFKRIVACMLMLCLLLCAAVPAAIAADTTDPIVYQFYQSSYSSSANALSARIDIIEKRYNGAATPELNWKYEAAHTSLATNESSFFSSAQSIRSNANINEWIAFRIKTPGVGKYAVQLAHGAGYYGAEKASAYILQGNTDDILTAIAATEPIITFDCSASGNEAGRISETGEYFFGEDLEYIVVFKADTRNVNSATSTLAYMYLNALEVTLVESYEAKIGTQYYTTIEAAVEAAGNGDTVKLVTDATATEISLPAGVTLDLNGKTLTANVKGSGTVTDSSVGSTGKIVGESAVQNVGENEIALYDGTATRIVGYTLVADDEAVVDETGATATFWYTFKFDNEETYGMIAAADNNAGFNVGATLAFNGNPVPVTLKDGTVSGWAGEMAKNPDAGYAFYVAVTGFENLDESVTGSLDVKLTVNGSAGSAESAVINYTID